MKFNDRKKKYKPVDNSLNSARQQFLRCELFEFVFFPPLIFKQLIYFLRE